MKQKNAVCFNITRCIVMNTRLFVSSFIRISTQKFFRNVCVFLPGYIPIFSYLERDFHSHSLVNLESR